MSMSDVVHGNRLLTPHPYKLPLFVLSCLARNGLCPTKLPEEAPALQSVLNRIFVGDGAPLSSTLENVAVAHEFRLAKTKLAEEREDCYRHVLPVMLLENFVKSNSDDANLESIRNLVAAFSARASLDWCVGRNGCGDDAWDRVITVRESVTEDSEWALLSSQVASHTATLLSDLVDLWNDSVGLCIQELKVDGPDDLSSAVAAARSVIEAAEQKSELSSARILLCNAAASRASAEMLRLTARAASHMVHAQLESDASEADALVTRARATVAKVRLVRAQAARDTYCVDGAVPALQNVRAIVEKKKVELEREVARKRAQLREYKNLGPTFEALAVEYRRILNDREQKRWSRDQLCNRPK